MMFLLSCVQVLVRLLLISLVYIGMMPKWAAYYHRRKKFLEAMTLSCIPLRLQASGMLYFEGFTGECDSEPQDYSQDFHA